MKFINLDYHPNDSRIKIKSDDICQSLTQRMGTGGAYVCLKSEEIIISNYKADGAIGGGVAFAIVGDHENRPTDMTNLVVYETDNTDREKVL